MGSRTERRGRRAAGNAGRADILRAATAQFGEHGYQGATIRNIARTAGVDAKLVHYYFGSKEELFSAAITELFERRGLPALLADAGRRDSEPAVGEVVGGARGARYLTAVLTALEDPATGPVFLGLIRTLGTHEESRRIFVDFITDEVLAKVGPRLGIDHASTRLALVGSQLLGLVTARYIMRVPQLADLTVAQAAAIYGPTFDRYLSAALPIE